MKLIGIPQWQAKHFAEGSMKPKVESASDSGSSTESPFSASVAKK